jgi:tRNA pseudouridine32 synthase / 23S rRNA pseudouridine746 synthase
MNEINLKEIILFEDDSLIVLNKPAGLLSIEDGYDNKKINLRSALREFYGSIWAVHRLDKDTSGVIIFAKDAYSHRVLNNSFSNRETKKSYRSIINGLPIWDSYEIKLPLQVNGDRKHRTIVDLINGKPAYTQFNILNSRDAYSYLEICPKTGLTHQIRAHLSSIGFPILGDSLYCHYCEINYFENIYQSQKLGSYFLHAYSLKFFHPISKLPMLITASLPFSFNQMLDNLKLNFNC